MSPEAKENAQALANALLETWRESVAKGRPKAQIDAYMRNTNAAVQAAGGDMAKAALNAGLVDKIAAATSVSGCRPTSRMRSPSSRKARSGS